MSDNEFKSMREHNVQPGDVVQRTSEDGSEYTVVEGPNPYGVDALWACRDGSPWLTGSEVVRVISRAKAKPSLPQIGVLHKHGGSDVCPVPGGTDVTRWYSTGPKRSVVGKHSVWLQVDAYLVHSYPDNDDFRTIRINPLALSKLRDDEWEDV